MLPTHMPKTDAAKRAKPEPFIHRYKDGSVWATGQTLDGKYTGYWEYFRKDGTRSGSGHFENGEKTGVWTTYRPDGTVEKVTTIKPKPAQKPAPR